MWSSGAPADLDVADAVGGLRLDELGATRSRASASCSSAIGRSNARSSSAWSAHGIGATSAPDIPAQSRGASTPRVRARSSAVSTRSEPSRWRWSSAFGIASTQAAQARAPVSGRGGRSPRWSSATDGGDRVDRFFRHRCPPSSSPAPAASSAATSSRPCSPPAIGSSHSSATPTAARPSSAACRPADRANVEVRIGDVTRPETLVPAMAGVDAVVHLVAIPRDFRGGARPAPRQHRGDPRPSSPRCGRPASAVSSTSARWASRTIPTSTTRARRRRPRRSCASPASTGRSSSRRSSSARATGSSTSSRASSGCRPASSRSRGTVAPLPADPHGDVAAVHRARPGRPGDHRRGVRARRAALLDVPRDHPRGPDRARQAARDRADAGRRSSGSWPGRPSSSTSRSRSRPTSSASSGSTTSARSTLIPARFGFEPRPMEGALGYLRAKRRDQVVQPA